MALFTAAKGPRAPDPTPVDEVVDAEPHQRRRGVSARVVSALKSDGWTVNDATHSLVHAPQSTSRSNEAPEKVFRHNTACWCCRRWTRVAHRTAPTRQC